VLAENSPDLSNRKLVAVVITEASLITRRKRAQSVVQDGLQNPVKNWMLRVLAIGGDLRFGSPLDGIESGIFADLINVSLRYDRAQPGRE